jgi:hypothetical protein
MHLYVVGAWDTSRSRSATLPFDAQSNFDIYSGAERGFGALLSADLTILRRRRMRNGLKRREI